MSKATHKGECQICGCQQLLPGGKLSNHGYTVKWGFFSGICSGAGRLPFELSTDAIQPVVDGVKATILAVEAEIAALEDLNSDVNGASKAWHNTYRDGYVWELVPVVDFQAKPLSGGGACYHVANVLVKNRKGVEQAQSIETYSQSFELTSVRHFVHFLNRKRAKFLRGQNSARRDWVRWQAERLAGWQLKELKAR